MPASLISREMLWPLPARAIGQIFQSRDGRSRCVSLHVIVAAESENHVSIFVCMFQETADCVRVHRFCVVSLRSKIELNVYPVEV